MLSTVYKICSKLLQADDFAFIYFGTASVSSVVLPVFEWRRTEKNGCQIFPSGWPPSEGSSTVNMPP